MGVSIQFRRGTTAQWASADPVLLAGEMGYDSTLNKFKMGNGTDVWTALAFVQGDVTVVVLKATYANAHSILVATVAETPAELVVAQQEVVGRLTGGNIDGIALGIADNNIVQIDGADVADDEYARFTASGLESRTAAEVIANLLASALPEDTVIQLDAVLSADEHWSGISILGTMGYSATVGDVVYLAVADSKWELAKADAAATASMILGVVLATTAENSTCQVLLYGKVRSAAFPAAFTVGAPVYLDYTNAGDVVVTMPAKATNRVVRIVGYGLTAEDMMFCPDPTYIEYA